MVNSKFAKYLNKRSSHRPSMFNGLGDTKRIFFIFFSYKIIKKKGEWSCIPWEKAWLIRVSVRYGEGL